MTFSDSWTPAVPGVATTAANWTFSGNFVNHSTQQRIWVPPDPPALGFWQYYGSVNYDTDSTLLNQQTTSAWWTSGGSSFPGTQYSATLQETVSFANGQQATLSRTGQFDMYRPSLFEWVITSQGKVTNYLSGSVEIVSVGTAAGVQTMIFHWRVQSAYAGSAGFTQTYDDESCPNASGSNVLDLAEFYIGSPVNVLTNSGAANILVLSDAPDEGSSLAGNFVSLVLQFRDYARFKPNLGDPSQNIYVTLGKVTWQVNASANSGTGGWALTPGSSVSTPVPDVSSTEFPFWLQVGSQ
jgi:hypothetical protein